MTIEHAITDPKYVQAQIELTVAKIEGQRYDNEMSRALASTATIAAERDALKNRWDRASGSFARIYYFPGEISSTSAYQCIDALSRWERIDAENEVSANQPYRISLCSPGGEVIAGFQLFSYLKGLSERRTLTISASGLCASMATIIHQAASPGCRIVEPGCSYLLHELSGSVGGRLDSLSDTADWLRQLNKNMYNIFADRTGIPAEELAERVQRREKFLTPEEVLEWGLADRVEYMGPV